MPIYTKTGDKGETSLFGGKRVSKDDVQVDAYGSIDELNCWVGLVSSQMNISEKKDLLEKIQADLLIIGGHLAGWKTDLHVLQTRVTEMEVEIDAMEDVLVPLKNFILPGGTLLAANIHLVRSTCRRVERQVVSLSKKQPVESSIIQYLNRLSDLLFVMARFINKVENIPDVIWSGMERNK